MKIFVGFGYNDRDKWIKDLVFPLVRAFGAEVMTGEDLHGGVISPEVIHRIQESVGLIAFVTRREELSPGKWTTHRWVTDELSAAITAQKRVLEIRESGVDAQLGIGLGRQHIVYDEARRDQCLVEIAKTVGGWARASRIRLQLLPDEFINKIKPFLRLPGLQCTFRCLTPEGEETPEVPARIIPIKGGLFVDIKDADPEAMVQVRVQANGWSWSSSYEPTDSVGITLIKE